MDSKGTRREQGTITLPTITAVALWTHEITGQLSDGMWEGTAPHNHFKFWCALDAVHSEGAKPTVHCVSGYCMKSNYNLLKLLDLGKEDVALRFCLRDRMLAKAKMATALTKLDLTVDYSPMCAAEYMPATLEAWQAAASAGSWEHDFVAEYMSEVTVELATEFYTVTYDLRDLKCDLAVIKDAMKTARA